MYRFSLIAASAALALSGAPAAAQDTDGEALVRGILQGVFGQQLQQSPQGTGPSAGARFDVSNLRDEDACDMIFTGSGQSGAVDPGSACPGALGRAAQWRRTGDNLELRDAANRLVWRGEPATTGEGWTGGAADTLLVYTIQPGGPAGPGATPGQPQFDAATLYGGWRAAEPGQTRGCRVTFVEPDSNNRYATQNAVETDFGCPARVGQAARWFHEDGALTLTNSAGAVLATLTRVNSDRWSGESEGVPIILTRL